MEIAHPCGAEGRNSDGCAHTLQDPDVVAAALKTLYKKPALGFSDCMLLELARKAGHLPLGTFDRALGKLQGAQAL